jgi:hypothetical protein
MEEEEVEVGEVVIQILLRVMEEQALEEVEMGEMKILVFTAHQILEVEVGAEVVILIVEVMAVPE